MTNLVFDIGDVLFLTARNKQYEALAHLTKRPVAQITTFFETQQLPLQHELGQLDSQALYELFVNWTGNPITYFEFASAWTAVLQAANDELWQVVEKLSARYAITLASNIGAIHWHHVKQTIDNHLTHYGTCLSFEIGHRKPHICFYEHLMGLLDGPRDDILFIDDSETNVRQAVALGIKGVVHASTAETIQILQPFLEER